MMHANAIEAHPMLAEKFLLVLETLISQRTGEHTVSYTNGAPKVMSKARFIPIITDDAVSAP